MNNIPEDILTIILHNYLYIHDTKYINKSFYNKYTMEQEKAKKIIYKYVYKYMKEYENSQNIDFFRIPKHVYKKYYPMCYRQTFIISAFNHIYSINDIERSQQLHDLMTSNNSIIFRFNKCIDLLNGEELYIIGW